MRLVSVARRICAAAVCDKHQVMLDQIDRLLLAVFHIHDLLGKLPVAHRFDDHVFHVHAILDAHPMRL